MDTNVKELKQGASKIADLLQRNSQDEVLEPKPSTASSDEERLAAGISTIGLQTKKLSGAQRRRFIKERKIKEGIWTEKPDRKDPPSQDKRMAVSSGGVKRPQSDSSTPSQEKQQPKKPRSTQVQTGTYKEAAVGIKRAIVHRLHPDIHLDQAQTDMNQERLLNSVHANPLEDAPPQFLYSKFAQGVFWITCANEHTKTWLTRTVSGLGELWEGTELTVVDSKDLPKRPRVLVRIPDICEANAVLTRLRKQNPELHTSE
jgi:hypothetical protein